MIDGLKLTFSGDELRMLLDTRIRLHERWADKWTHAHTRSPQDTSEDGPDVITVQRK